MKTAEYVKSLRAKSAEQLGEELGALRKEQFNLRMQSATGQLTQTHQMGEVKRKIARVKSILQQKASQQEAQA